MSTPTKNYLYTQTNYSNKIQTIVTSISLQGVPGNTGSPGPNLVSNTTPTSGIPATSFLTSDGTKVGYITPPLVFDGGGAGGTGTPGSGTGVIGGGTVSATLNNADSIDLPSGTVVSINNSGFIRASSPNNAAVGIIPNTTNIGVGGYVQVSGCLSLSDWTNCVGSTTLSPKQLYYLDVNNPGKLTTTLPSTGIYQLVGEALTASTMMLIISPSIQL